MQEPPVSIRTVIFSADRPFFLRLVSKSLEYLHVYFFIQAFLNPIQSNPTFLNQLAAVIATNATSVPSDELRITGENVS